MGNVRRWYVYLVCAVTIQVVTWAAINLLRNLSIGSTVPTVIALQISAIIVALPLYLAHWIWAQRRAAFDEEERAALPRLLYLYIMMTAFLAPLINNAYFLARALLHLLLGVAPSGFRAMSPGRSVWFNLLPLVVLGALWFYHRRVRDEDEKIGPVSEASIAVFAVSRMDTVNIW